ncbi:hypothetical protein [Phaeobacter phage MD18]|nr:hypothetical protein [Phaeobacter phage MD18]
MSFRITTSHSFIIDGDELNAGARAFVRDARMFVMDGTDFGTASDRMFLKDFRLFAIDGQALNHTRPRVNTTGLFAIEGRASDTGLRAFSTLFEISGTPGQQSIVAVRETNFFALENASQETPP